MSTPIARQAKLDKYIRFQRTGVVFIPYVSSFVQVMSFNKNSNGPKKLGAENQQT